VRSCGLSLLERRAERVRVVARDHDARRAGLDGSLDSRLLRRCGVLGARLDDLLVLQFCEGDLAAPVCDDLVRVERVLRDEVERLPCRRAVRAGECGRDGEAGDEERRGKDRPPVLLHGWILSHGSLGHGTSVGVRLLSHYRGYAAVSPPSTLTTLPVDLCERGPTKNAIASATSSGSTATPSFVRLL